MPWLTAQVDTAAKAVEQSVREFGATVTVLFLALGLLAGLVIYLITRFWPEQVKQLREDAQVQRIEAQKEREAAAAANTLQRTEFLSTLHNLIEQNRQEAQAARQETRALLAEQAAAFKESLAQIENRAERSNAEICRRLDALTTEVEALAERDK
jgi:hypothetical protein